MKNFYRSLAALVLLGILVLGCEKDEDLWDWMIPETDDTATTSQVTGYVFQPAQVAATPENMQRLQVPAGFRVAPFAQQLGKPRILVTDAAGHVYYSDREAGTVTLLQDADGDGTAEIKTVVANIRQAHGLAIHNGQLYIAAVRELYRAPINTDGTLGTPALLRNDLPDAGQHPNRTLAFGPDGRMYLSIGSTCNACAEPNPLNATMAVGDADGNNMQVFAKGLRNTIGFGWHPQTGELWGMDHGIDWLGDEDQKEELNQIKQNGVYGWPYIYGEGKYNPHPRPQGDTTYQQYLSLTTLPSLLYQAHAAPMQMVFHTGTGLPADYQGDAFVAMRGSWNRSQPVGYKVVRVQFENGVPRSIDDFLTGFLVDNNRSVFGRPVGITQMADGSLLVSDDTGGVIYRVSRQ